MGQSSAGSDGAEFGRFGWVRVRQVRMGQSSAGSDGSESRRAATRVWWVVLEPGWVARKSSSVQFVIRKTKQTTSV